MEHSLDSVIAEVMNLREEVDRLRRHSLNHELGGQDTVRPSVQNGGTQLNRQRTLNASTGITATEDATNKRIDLTVTDPLPLDSLDLSEIAVPDSPSADTLRIFAEDYKGFSFLSFKDTTGMVRKFVRDSVFVGKNVTGSTIAASRIVYASGSADDVPTIALAKADSTTTMPAIGVTIESMADGAFGRVMQVGLLEGVNTSAYSVGDVLYVSPTTAGVPTGTEPAYPNIRQEIGTILVDDASVGAIQIVARTAIDYDFGSAGIAGDAIVESTTDAGVTIDTCLIKDGNVDGVDVSTHASRHNAGGADAISGFARIYTGTYTGDGATSQAITAPGFQPKFVMITTRQTADNTNIDVYVTTDQIVDDHANGVSVLLNWAPPQTNIDTIISLDATGFTVDDAGADEHPNKNGTTYNYVCIG